MLALNYDGDPHPYSYPIYPPMSRMNADRWGTGRLPSLVTRLRPDVVVLTNDPWNLPMYMQAVGDTPVVASVAVDGKNCRGEAMNGLRHAIFWTQFGQDEARLGGYSGPASIVPLGVDLSVYHPTEQAGSRRRVGLPAQLRGSDTFIVGVVGRNQPRKRIDLAMLYFAKWIKQTRNQNAYLFLHIGPTGDRGFEVQQLAKYLQIHNRIIVSEPEIGHGMPEEHLKFIYGSFDVMLGTPQGEGWGLTHMEGMACGVPQIVPRWAALGEWADGAAHFVECTTLACTPNNINVIGGVADEAQTIEALQLLYEDRAYRAGLRDAGLALVAQPQYRWEHIGKAFRNVLDQALVPALLQEATA